jgi:hypothetical protein
MAIDGDAPTLIKALKTIAVRSIPEGRLVTHLSIRHVVVCNTVRCKAGDVHLVTS